LPHDFVGKYLAKAENGFWHSKAFTLEDFENIRKRPASSGALKSLIDEIDTAQKHGAAEKKLTAARQMHRKAQWRADLVVSENSIGFHASAEVARILGESIDYSRQGVLKLLKDE
jgi:nitrite reductase (cytochrome c-552)